MNYLKSRASRIRDSLDPDRPSPGDLDEIERLLSEARALKNRLEISGKKSLDLTQARDAHGLKILLKEGASSVRVLRLQVYGFAADVPQRAMDRSVDHARSVDAIVQQCRYERHRGPLFLRHSGDQPLTAWCPAVDARHVRLYAPRT